MNWTEGNLARHSRPSKAREALLRQKEHFAKIRSGLLNANVKISPPSISFLAHPAHSSSPARRSAPRHKTSSSSSSRKRTSDERPLQLSRYFQAGSSHELAVPADYHNSQAEEEALHQKRRKLLLQGDWTGIALQKPIEMEFPKPRASVGSPWGHSMSRHAKTTSRMRQILGIKYDSGQSRALKAKVKTTRSPSRSQLRVRVGNRERVFGGSSNASPRSMTCKDVESSPHVSHNPESKHDRRQPSLTHHDNSSISDSGNQFPESPVLHQPLPQRHFMPCLLRSQSSDLDDAASTKARIGVLEPSIPSSRVDDNEAWWSFVGGADRSSCANDIQHPQIQGAAVQREISPGVSHFGLAETIDGPGNQVEFTDSSASAVNAKPNVQSEPSVRRREGLLQSHELKILIGGVSKDNDDCLIADRSNFSSMGSSPPRNKQNSETDMGVVRTSQSGHQVDSDEVSLQVLPTSSSPASEELLAQFHNCTNFRGHIDDALVPSILPESHQPEKKHATLKLSEQQQGMAIKQKQLLAPPKTKEDENDIWRQFVFGESDSNLRKAFEEAKKQTAKNLRPSDPSTSSISEDGTYESTHVYPELPMTTAALSIGPTVETLGFTDQQDSSSTNTSTMMSVSHMATFGYSSPDPLSASTPACSGIRAIVGDSSPDHLPAPYQGCSGTTMQSDEAIAGSSSSSKDGPLDLVDGFIGRSDAWSFVAGGQGHQSIIAHPPSAASPSEADDVFRFAPPKPFLGRKIQIDEKRHIALSTPQIQGKGVTWRRQKRTGDGRANIRNLPNFHSDPIEEVEEVVSNRGAQKSSMFGLLETEE